MSEAYESRPKEELLELAKELLAGTVFTDRHLKDQDMLPMVFVVLALGGPESLEWLKANKIAMVYERMSKAGPRSINGYPVFMSANFLDEADAEAVMGYYAKLKAAQESVAP